MFLRTTLSCLCLLASYSAFAANGCPNIKDIKRTSGEYSWISYVPGWSGQFVFPQQGKGHSTHVTGFIEARWIQLTNLENSQGYFECDYQGNYDSEVIRFTQSGTRANMKPTDIHWSCQLNPQFPGTQCTCSGSTELCILEEVDNRVAKPMYIDPAATNTGESIPPLDGYMDK